jgi:hypothetical protein
LHRQPLFVDRTEPEYPFIPGVSPGFTRQTSQEVPRTREGLPVHVTSVLVGGEHHYDFRRSGSRRYRGHGRTRAWSRTTTV